MLNNYSNQLSMELIPVKIMLLGVSPAPLVPSLPGSVVALLHPLPEEALPTRAI